jgi:hypothetical protein
LVRKAVKQGGKRTERARRASRDEEKGGGKTYSAPEKR